MYPAYPLVIVGDLHGRLDLLRAALESLHLITADGRWTGGDRRLIQLGDVIDRGPNGLAAMRFLRRLQEEAAEAGGAVTLLLGNHELFALPAGVSDHGARMSWLYNGGGSGYAEWAGAGATERDWPFPEEFYALFAPTGEFGSWLRRHQAAVMAGDLLVVHAGPFAGTLHDLNADLRAVLSDPELLRQRARASSDPLLGLEGPFWAREIVPEVLEACLRTHGAARLVTGHTPVGGIRVSHSGQLIQIDAGMTYYGSWACLGLDAAGRPWALLEGQEPHAISGDRFYPLSVPRQGRFRSARARHAPGSWLQLYRSADGRFAQYFIVQGVHDLYGQQRYQGLHLQTEGPEVEAKAVLWPVELVDRLGRRVTPAADLEEMLRKA